MQVKLSIENISQIHCNQKQENVHKTVNLTTCSKYLPLRPAHHHFLSQPQSTQHHLALIMQNTTNTKEMIYDKRNYIYIHLLLVCVKNALLLCKSQHSTCKLYTWCCLICTYYISLHCKFIKCDHPWQGKRDRSIIQNSESFFPPCWRSQKCV